MDSGPPAPEKAPVASSEDREAEAFCDSLTYEFVPATAADLPI